MVSQIERYSHVFLVTRERGTIHCVYASQIQFRYFSLLNNYISSVKCWNMCVTLADSTVFTVYERGSLLGSGVIGMKQMYTHLCAHVLSNYFLVCQLHPASS